MRDGAVAQRGHTMIGDMGRRPQQQKRSTNQPILTLKLVPRGPSAHPMAPGRGKPSIPVAGGRVEPGMIDLVWPGWVH